MSFIQNPDYKSEQIDDASELKDSYYSSLIIGSKPFFNMLEEYFASKERKDLIGVSLDGMTLNVYFKKNEPDIE
jgi:hypothetical protein